ncbi:hypothetical protein CAPTEDRAFT_155141 [Capitella teleta]|uniref:RING-type E3 ubiquitin transferase n=1 Tax=Capitella teleta TaxID=283909 RepID=R7T976_CAPTE|nr:hypothetical protein CAPTEDRAFT_155141 [Capitella teleta]|eukprot:ELT89988.1 hypothetical protein CAPTEDRAFT_155141 [Capitella teleta]
MGNFISRRNSGVEQVDFSNTNAYRYPPKSGTYFGTHYIMGGERFETTQPEAYLFGENQDLNFLGNKPVPFPYPAPQTNEPTKTLKSLVNIRRDSVRFVKATEEGAKQNNSNNASTDATPTPPPTKYNIEFTFDSDVRCAITIYYFAREEIESKKLVYHPRDPAMNSETFRYKQGANQTFNQSTHVVDPSQYPEEEWQFNPDKDIFPVAIHCVVEDEDHVGHSQVTMAIVEKTSEGGYTLKPLKQKQMVDGLCYLLQEIYGIENKSSNRAKDEDVDDSGSECVICMSEMRDTIILSCRHLCLCNVCADSLRYQANNCPICRAPFRALLQIRAMKKKPTNIALPSSPSAQGDAGENPLSQDGIPPGYEAVALIEALNGSCAPPPSLAPLSMHPDGNSTLRSNASSLPTSPDESPIMKQRKIKRHPSQNSVRSHRSVGSQSESISAEAGAVGGDDLSNRAATPVVCMTGQAPDPTKSPSHPVKVPQVRYLSPKKGSNTDSVEIIDELQANDEKYESSSLPPIEDSEETEDATCTSRQSSSPPSCADDDEEIPEEIEVEEDDE